MWGRGDSIHVCGVWGVRQSVWCRGDSIHVWWVGVRQCVAGVTPYMCVVCGGETVWGVGVRVCVGVRQCGGQG